MYSALLVAFFSVAAAFPSDVPQECMEEIQRTYNEHIALTPGQARDQAAIMEQVMKNIDFTKCENVQFRLQMHDANENNNGNVWNVQQPAPNVPVVFEPTNNGFNTGRQFKDLNEKDDEYVLNIKGSEAHSSSQSQTQNNQNFYFDQRARNFNGPQQGFPDRRYQFNQNNHPNFGQPGFPNDRGFNNYQNFRQPYLPQNRPLTFPDRHTDNLYFNNRHPVNHPSGNSGNFGQRFDNRGPNGYYNQRPNVPYNRPGYVNRDIRQTNEEQISPVKFENYGSPYRWGDNPNYGNKEISDSEQDKIIQSDKAEQSNSQNVNTNGEWQVVDYAPTKIDQPTANSAAISETKTESATAKAIADDQNIDIFANKQNLYQHQTKDDKTTTDASSDIVRPIKENDKMDVVKPTNNFMKDLVKPVEELYDWSSTTESTTEYTTTDATTETPDANTETPEQDKSTTSTPKPDSSTQKPNDDNQNNDQGKNNTGYNDQGLLNNQGYSNQVGNIVTQNGNYGPPKPIQIDFVALIINIFKKMSEWWNSFMVTMRSYFGSW